MPESGSKVGANRLREVNFRYQGDAVDAQNDFFDTFCFKNEHCVILTPFKPHHD